MTILSNSVDCWQCIAVSSRFLSCRWCRLMVNMAPPTMITMTATRQIRLVDHVGLVLLYSLSVNYMQVQVVWCACNTTDELASKRSCVVPLSISLFFYVRVVILIHE